MVRMMIPIALLVVACTTRQEQAPRKKFKCASGPVPQCFDSVPPCVGTAVFSGGDDCYEQDHAWCAWDDGEGMMCWATAAVCAKIAPSLSSGVTPTCHRVDDPREMVRPVVVPGAARGR